MKDALSVTRICNIFYLYIGFVKLLQCKELRTSLSSLKTDRKVGRKNGLRDTMVIKHTLWLGDQTSDYYARLNQFATCLPSYMVNWENCESCLASS